MSLRPLLFAPLLLMAHATHAQGALDLIVATDEVKTLEKGLYEFRSVQIANRGKLVLTGGVTIASDKFSSDDGAAIEYRSDSNVQENISISTLDASGLRFLYINANGKPGADQSGMASAGPGGRGAKGEPFGRSSSRGGQGGTGAPGGAGQSAANVSMQLPNMKVGSLLRIHAIGGSGGKGQQGGPGGRGGGGAFGHPASDGGPGGTGGNGGAAGGAGRIVVKLVVADNATETDKEALLKALRLEYTNSSGTPGEGGPGGPSGGGGGGAVGGGDGSGGSRGSLGSGGAQGAIGDGPTSKPMERWSETSILTQSQYAQAYTLTLQKIREAVAAK